LNLLLLVNLLAGHTYITTIYSLVIRTVYLLHRKGSVVVDYSLWVYSSLSDEELLKDVLRYQSVINIDGSKVDLESIKVSSKFNLPFKLSCYMYMSSMSLCDETSLHFYI